MNHSTLLALISALVMVPAVQGETLQQAVAECKLIIDDTKRLACFDALTISTPATPESKAVVSANSKAEQAPTVSPTKASGKTQSEQTVTSKRKTAPTSNVTQQDPASEFGLAPKTPVEEIDRITSTITNIEDAARTGRYLYLQNGSVWKQTDGKRMRLRKGQEIYIERGLLGAFYLSYEGVNSRIKVKRIK